MLIVSESVCMVLIVWLLEDNLIFNTSEWWVLWNLLQYTVHIWVHFPGSMGGGNGDEPALRNRGHSGRITWAQISAGQLT